LLAEGVAESRIDLIGNIMIDSFAMMRSRIDASTARRDLGCEDRDYAVVTLHRPSNVDQVDTPEPITEQLIEAAKELPVLFVANPRTVKSLETLGRLGKLEAASQIRLLEPLPYGDFMNVVVGATGVIAE